MIGYNRPVHLNSFFVIWVLFFVCYKSNKNKKLDKDNIGEHECDSSGFFQLFRFAKHNYECIKRLCRTIEQICYSLKMFDRIKNVEKNIFVKLQQDKLATQLKQHIDIFYTKVNTVYNNHVYLHYTIYTDNTFAAGFTFIKHFHFWRVLFLLFFYFSYKINKKIFSISYMLNII